MFEAYRPEHHGTPMEAVQVRTATPYDAHAIGLIYRQHLGGPAVTEQIRAELVMIEANTIQKQVWVAFAGQVLGYGRCAWLDLAGARNLPAGWYLSGVGVAKAHRRRGVARRLTVSRLDWLRAHGCRQVYCFVSQENEASVALHRNLGFEVRSRDIVHPKLTFPKGGLLLSANLPI